MKRRTVLKSIAAALMCPNITLRQSFPDERLLAAFCEQGCRIWDLESPFGLGSLTYATDRVTLIRCELPSRLEEGERRLPRCVPQVWEDYWHPKQQWVPLTPESAKPVESYKKIMWQPCPQCDSAASVSLGTEYPDFSNQQIDRDITRFGYDVDTNCIRDKSCPVCHGLDYNGPSVAVVDGVRHSAYLLKRILALPGAEVCQSQSMPQAILFRANGFEGISVGVME